MSKPWGGIGAWAADAERAEAEELEQQTSAAAAATAAKSQFLGVGSHGGGGGGGGESQSFPSLKESIAAKPKKKKQQTMTLSEFTTGTYVGPGGARRDSASESKGLTTDELLRLPTGPKERSAEEMDYGRLGGGFRSYGMSGSASGRRDRSDGNSDGSWGGGGGGGRRSYGGFDDDRRDSGPRVSDMDQPSRADEVDNWAMGKKSLPSMDSGRQDRYSSLGSGSGGGSRADDVDNWAAGKKSMPAPPTRASNFGSGYKDSPSAADGDRWSRGGGGGGGGGGMREMDRSLSSLDGNRERPRLVLNPRQGDVVQNEAAKSSKPSPFGAARPREEILAEKGLDWRKQDSEIETRKTSRPTSSHSSRPSSAHSNRPESPAAPLIGEAAPKARPKVNPFGDAKPREVLLQEQGKDWKKIDMELEHRRVDRPETEEEKSLKEEIDHLKKELENEATVNANGESVEGSSEPQTKLNDLILSRERDLELLIRELDDKVRFGQKSSERPVSGAGRFTFSDRVPSQTDFIEESRNMEFRDRPRSRGSDAWSRPGDDRRSFQGGGPGDDRRSFQGGGPGGRERGFMGNNDMDRSKSSGRW